MIAGRDLTQVPTVSVGRLANYLKKKIDGDPKLALVGVEGEISNLRAVASSGHVFFRLKDGDVVLECFAFASDAATFPQVADGTAVVAYGKVGTYPQKSVYQLTVRHIELAGLGKLFARYEELKRRLHAEGLFADERKRALPRYPFRVALVGSRAGDGTRDFFAQARARAPHVRIELFDTPVQGDAAPQIVGALQRASASRPDLIVIARGGGSFEDLFVFSDERLVRAVAAATVPIVSAIGHEADVPLIDLAADRRASTPSTAAQTVLPHRDDLLRELRRDGAALARGAQATVGRARRALERVEYRSPLADPSRLLGGPAQRVVGAHDALRRAAERRVRRYAERLAALDRQILRVNPQTRVVQRRERFDRLRPRFEALELRIVQGRHGAIDEFAALLRTRVDRSLERKRERLRFAEARLRGNDPEALLARGYAIVEGPQGGVLVDPAQAPAGTRLRVRLARGELAARVERDGQDGGEQIGLF